MSASATNRVLDELFDALANGQRRLILTQLARGPVTTPQIAKRFGFSKQALSRHIAVLEDAGLIDRSARGRMRHLRLVPGRLERITAWIEHLQRGWETSLDRLAEVLGE